MTSLIQWGVFIVAVNRLPVPVKTGIPTGEWYDYYVDSDLITLTVSQEILQKLCQLP